MEFHNSILDKNTFLYLQRVDRKFWKLHQNRSKIVAEQYLSTHEIHFSLHFKLRSRYYSIHYICSISSFICQKHNISPLQALLHRERSLLTTVVSDLSFFLRYLPGTERIGPRGAVYLNIRLKVFHLKSRDKIYLFIGLGNLVL